MSEKIKIPELEKLTKVRDASLIISNFIGWLYEEKIELAKYKEREEYSDILIPHREDTESLLARYFNIDLNKVEKERQALLNNIREKNG